MLVIVGLFFSVPVLAQDGPSVQEQIKAHCKDKWGSDYRMQKYCIDRQSESARWIGSFLEKHKESSEERNIANRCFSKWKEGDRFDFRMVKYCTDRQIEAYRQIQ